ncbi:MAG: tRNA (adenosine(37)-N6)-threonylcarbamoyltransferase complex ATPase subunit type 1 TsaE [Gammaproteobacteria bacterium]
MNSSTGSVFLADEAAMSEWAARTLGFLIRALDAAGEGVLMTLDGPLGAGKSTLARAVLRAAGVSGPVPSPTYTLVEPYAVANLNFLHMDLYRLNDPDELALLGLDDLRGARTISLVEWSSRLPAALGVPTLAVVLDYEGSGRRLDWRLQ